MYTIQVVNVAGEILESLPAFSNAEAHSLQRALASSYSRLENLVRIMFRARQSL